MARLRRKQILGVQFYRQKPIANYIADYAPAAKLVATALTKGTFSTKSYAYWTMPSSIRGSAIFEYRALGFLASRKRVGADSLADSSLMDGSSLLQREARRDFSWLEDRLQHGLCL